MKSPIFSVSGFTFSEIANIWIFIILYDLCLLRAQFCNIIINIQDLESQEQLVDRFAPLKFTNSVENLDFKCYNFVRSAIYSLVEQEHLISDMINTLRRIILMLLLIAHFWLGNVQKALASVISICNPLVVKYTEVFYMFHKRALQSIQNEMNLRWSKSMREVQSLMFI